MNIHLPAILMFTRGTRFWPIPMQPIAHPAGPRHLFSLLNLPLFAPHDLMNQSWVCRNLSKGAPQFQVKQKDIKRPFVHGSLVEKYGKVTVVHRTIRPKPLWLITWSPIYSWVI
jgi:hypothetical protein